MNSMGHHDSEKNSTLTAATQEIINKTDISKLVPQAKQGQCIDKYGDDWEDYVKQNSMKKNLDSKKRIDIKVLSSVRLKSLSDRSIKYMATEHELSDKNVAEPKSPRSLQEQLIKAIMLLHTEKSASRPSNHIPSSGTKIDDKKHNR